MGMIAEYLMIDQETLDSLIDLSNEDLTNKIFEIEETEKFERIDIDKIWDVLHFFLTGVSASEPIEDNKLSEAVVGVDNFNPDDENADFVSLIKNEALAEIVIVIEKVDFEKLTTNFDLQLLKKNKIYPNGIWKDDRAQLLEEIKESLNSILDFYKKALLTKHHIIVSIL
ncbi:YfbM family protein [Flavobacterium sp. EDS]|uniref:YfbM family protein n=1 Tax=Flavobacterium sp. EDS TaxID=2897328 RepID=UPI001E4D59FE|nr:YfbM family protein [Flavobacterium sp. EDS]MCD0476621.1 YfbM family protein [Flavobacterium sp. EDS]